MEETSNIRMQRIERLLKELEYEVTRGMMEGEIYETLGFDFCVPLSKRINDGVVMCSFRTRPMHRAAAVGVVGLLEPTPRLRVVK